MIRPGRPQAGGRPVDREGRRLDVVGAGIIKSIPIIAGSVIRSMAKQDKPVSKAINLLVEAMDKWVQPGALNPNLDTSITRLLGQLPASRHRDALQQALNEKRATGGG